MLRPTAIPQPNQITSKAVEKWLASLPPHDKKLDPILTSLLLAFGICDSIIGVEQAILNFLPHAPFIKGKVTEAEKKEIRNLLIEALIGQDNKKSDIKNPLIKFHLKNNETPQYLLLAVQMHIGIIGRYIQVHRKPDYIEKINDILSPLNIVLTHLTPNDLTNPNDPKTTKKEITAVLRRATKRRHDGTGNIHYAPGTIRGYTTTFLDVLYNEFPSKPYKRGVGGSRKKFYRGNPRDSFRPDHLPLNHATRESYGRQVIEQWLAEIADEDPQKAKNLKKPSSKKRGVSQAYLDPYRTPANADRLSLHALARIEEIIQSPKFISNHFNRLAFEITYHLMLHTRRPINYIAAIQIGVPVSAVVNGPVLNLEAGVIYYIPRFYFGKPETLIGDYGFDYFLKAEDPWSAWDSEFEGYANSAIISALPLPRLVLDEIIEYRQMLPELPSQMLSWQDESKALMPVDNTWLNQGLKTLTTLLQAHKTGHRRITQTLIKYSFDAYYINRLNCADYWHISERAKYVFEMPARYTGLTSQELAGRYFLVHNEFLGEIEQVAKNQLHLTRTSLGSAKNIPLIVLGSWHGLELEVITGLAAFFRSPEAKKLVPSNLTRSQKQHNLLVYETIFWAGALEGLRDFEPPRLEISDYCPENQSLVIRGRGGRMRELPLDTALAERIERLLRARREPETTQLLWLYGKTGRQVRLTTKKVNAFFAQACLALGWEALDFYGLRHRYRSELVRLGLPDPIINYLMGHGKNYVSNFSQNSLDETVWRAYLPAANQLIEKFGLL